MIKKKTVFVIGAAAHSDLGFPLGLALLKSIVSALDFDISPNVAGTGSEEVLEAVKLQISQKTIDPNMEVHLNAARSVASAARMGISIDEVLHKLEDDNCTNVGKLAIADCILGHEQRSPLAHAETSLAIVEKLEKGVQGEESWYLSFCKQLFDVRKSELETLFNNLTIINFNYDRALEFFLTPAIQTHYGVTLDVAQNIASLANILRPYGRLGRLPWEKTTEDPINFGQRTPENILKCAGCLKTYTQTVDGKVDDRIRFAIAEAEQIIFMGFGYASQNLKLLRCEQKRDFRMFGTAFEMSHPMLMNLEERLRTELGSKETYSRGYFVPEGCTQFFRHFGRIIFDS